MAFKLAFGSYIGDGNTARAFTGLGFQPKFVMVNRIDTTNALGVIGKMNENSVDSSVPGYGENSANVNQLISSLDADGFTIGSKAGINVSGGSFAWAAFGGDATEIVVGSYIGNGLDNRDIGSPLGFKPTWVIIKGYNNDFATQKQGTTGDATDSSMSFSVFANAANEIQALASGSFQIGTSAKVNVSNGSYYFIAIAPGSHIFTGSYVGDGTNVRAFTEVGWKPGFISTKHNSATNAAAWTNGSMLGSNSVAYRAAAQFAGGFKSLDATGFTLGSDARVNTSGGSYHYVALRTTPSTTTTGSNSIKSDASIYASLTNTIKSDSDIRAMTSVKSDLSIYATGSNSITSQSFISPVCYTVYLTDKSNGQTLQAVELKDSHSIALHNMLQWAHNGIGSSIQQNFHRDVFATDNAYRLKHMIYVTGGSYQTLNFGSTFFVLITCGSLNPSDFNINGCKTYQYAPGSYLMYGPDGPSLGSSRARVMKTLFFGDQTAFSALNPRAGSEYIYQLGSIYVSTNSFEDVGKRAYLARIAGNKILPNFDTTQYNSIVAGSLESNAGSVWSWSYITTSGTAATTLGSWSVPYGTVRNGASNGTSDETGLDTSSDVVVNAATVQMAIIIIANTGGAGGNGNGSLYSYFLTNGSAIFNQENNDLPLTGSRFRDFLGSGVPKLGSITTTDLLDFNNCWVQTAPVIPGIGGSVDTIVMRWLGSSASDTGSYVSVSTDGGSNFITICDGILGSIGPNTTGSLIFRLDFYRTGSNTRDYTNGFDAYYG